MCKKLESIDHACFTFSPPGALGVVRQTPKGRSYLDGPDNFKFRTLKNKIIVLAASEITTN
jgi:hypothetical protein